MNESKISVRYAKALFALAFENHALDHVKTDVETLVQCIREISDFQFVIHSPVIRTSEKKALFTELFSPAFHSLTLSFITLLLDHRREDYLEGIARHFLTLMRKEQGVRTAGVITAVPLSESLRQSVLKLIGRKFNATVELKEEVDENLIGGFILRVGDQQIDASIATKLKRIEKDLIQTQY
jgi:F-type H+-transporting ATPase subunit delta